MSIRSISDEWRRGIVSEVVRVLGEPSMNQVFENVCCARVSNPAHPPTEGLPECRLSIEANVTLGRPSVGRVGGVGDPRRARTIRGTASLDS